VLEGDAPSTCEELAMKEKIIKNKNNNNSKYKKYSP